MVRGPPYACYNELAAFLAQRVPAWSVFHVMHLSSRRGFIRYRFRDDALVALQALQGSKPRGC